MAKYTPEELLKYAEEEDLISGIENAMFNNDKDWAFLPIECKDMIKKENGKYYILTELYDEELGWYDEEVECELDFEPVVLAAVKKKQISAAIVCHKDEFGLIFAIGDNREDTVNHDLMIDFLEYCGVDTRGRLKVLIEKGFQLLEVYNEAVLGSPLDYADLLENYQ